MQTPDEDPRSAFVRHLPRKIVEIKATLGAILADPRQQRMRDELRRRVDAVLTLARAHQLRSLADALQATSEALTESRAAAALTRPQLDRLTALIASLTARAELDTRDPDAPGVRAMAIPSAFRLDHAPTRTLIPGAAPSPGAPTLQDLARAVGGRTAETLAPGPARASVAHATQVLFVGSSIRASALLDALGHDADVVLAQTADEALGRARDAAPDIIIAEDDSPYDAVALAAAVASDPLVRFIPVVVIACDGEPAATVRARCPEAFDVLESDASADALRARVHRALRGSPSLPAPSAHELGELTLDELIRALQEELRRGLGGAVAPNTRHARVALGAGNEVLAATWEAIARIRAVVERRSGGTVRFELPVAPRGLPGAEVFAPGANADAAPDDEPADDPLPNRRALVVDDDPAVVAQFSELLRGAGMIVSAHTDGAAALAAARAERPDVVLADILMPGLDGFGLCRAIRRDVALRHTPVILLSWRDDLLVRMRELGAQASGYLRKEAAGGAVLARVRSTLRGRARTLRRVAELATGAEVRGRVERVGSVALIEAAARSLGDATISLIDSGSVTELELRQGSLLSAIRTVQDGSLARGESALARALGLSAARFVVRRASHAVRENITGRLADVLERSVRRVTALEEAVSGATLLEVVRVEFDADAALEYARSLPTPLRVAVERMVQGDAPRDMVLRDGLAPQDLEPLLIELSRRGAIQRVVGRNREDLAALQGPRAPGARAAPESSATWGTIGLESGAASQGELDDVVAKVTRPMSRAPTADTLADAVWRELRDSVEEPTRPTPSPRRAPAGDDPAARTPTARPSDLDDVGARVTVEPAGPASPGAPSTPSPTREPRWEPDASDVRDTRSLVPLARPEVGVDPAARPTPEPPAVVAGEPEELSSSELMVVRASPEPMLLAPLSDQHSRETMRPRGDDAAAVQPIAPSDQAVVPRVEPVAAAPLLVVVEHDSDPAFDLVVPRASQSSNPPKKPASKPPAGETPVAAPAVEPETGGLDLPDVKTSTTLVASLRPAADADAAEVSAAPPAAAPTAPTRAATSTTSQSTAIAPAELSWTRPLLLMAGVAAALALSYGAVRWYLAEDPARPAPVAEARDAATAAPTAAPNGVAQPGAAEGAILPTGPVPGGPAPSVTVNGPYRDAAPFLDGGALPATSGVLVIPLARRPGAPMEVSISGRSVGTAPLQLVLREGFYQVRFRAGVVTATHFVVVRRGLAAMLEPPSDR